jgi:hypothetical protein
MNDSAALVLIMSGMLAAGYAVAALFFLRFWRRSGDRLFLFFATAFALLVVQRLGLSWVAFHDGATFGFYALRLVAFLVLLAGIVDKNRS